MAAARRVRVHGARVAWQLLVGQLLTVPAPPFLSVYYQSVLLDLCKGLPSLYEPAVRTHSLEHWKERVDRSAHAGAGVVRTPARCCGRLSTWWRSCTAGCASWTARSCTGWANGSPFTSAALTLTFPGGYGMSAQDKQRCARLRPPTTLRRGGVRWVWQAVGARRLRPGPRYRRGGVGAPRACTARPVRDPARWTRIFKAGPFLMLQCGPSSGATLQAGVL